MLLHNLVLASRLSLTQLESYAATASVRYKVYEIPKRSGGVRKIEQPSREIKAIQRWLDRSLLSMFPVHGSATAYSKGASIKENALRHSHTLFTLRMDFREYFPSFKMHHVSMFLRENFVESVILDDQDIQFATRIFCRNGALTIGAPASPKLTNAMMYFFDDLLYVFCSRNNLVYTRYADDIFISSCEPGILSEVVHYVNELARSFKYADLSINSEKTAFLSRKYRRSITGLVITPVGGVSIGRDKKEKLKSQLYKIKKRSAF